MPSSTDDLLLFAAVAEAGSLTAASTRLEIPKATVSRRLSALEANLGQRLLLRTTRRIALTEFGQGYLEHCQRIAEEVAAAADFAHSRQSVPRGVLRVSMPEGLAIQILSTALASFGALHAEVQLELDLSPRRVDLIAERYDLALRMGDLGDDTTLVARRLTTLEFGLYASTGYLAQHPAPAHPDQLDGHCCLRLLAGRGGPTPWVLRANGEVWEGVPPGSLSVNSVGLMLEMLRAGAGIAALPLRFVRQDLAAGRLAPVMPQWQLPGQAVWALMPTRRYLPAKTRAFLEHIEQALRA